MMFLSKLKQLFLKCFFIPQFSIHLMKIIMLLFNVIITIAASMVRIRITKR